MLRFLRCEPTQKGIMPSGQLLINPIIKLLVLFHVDFNVVVGESFGYNLKRIELNNNFAGIRFG